MLFATVILSETISQRVVLGEFTKVELIAKMTNMANVMQAGGMMTVAEKNNLVAIMAGIINNTIQE